MSYDLERSAIEKRFRDGWADATPFGLDGQKMTPAENTVQLSIQSGSVEQYSIGRVANKVGHMGTLTVTIYTEGGAGSSAWRGYAETIMGIFHGVTVDQNGVPITTAADAFVKFSPTGPRGQNQMHPYVGASFPDAPFHVTNIIVPFVRFSLK